MHVHSLLLFALVIIYDITKVASHSWLACADYTAELSNDEQDFDYANCEGYIRGHFDTNRPDSFSLGVPKYTVSSDNGATLSCQYDITDPITDQYTDDYPYATYTPGSTYRLTWPAKNHAIGEECGETTSVDEAMAVYVNPNVNPTSDLTSISQYTLVYDWHAESGQDFSDGKGKEGIPFANCMDYCSDTDASPCWGDMTIPTNIFTQSGFYTFLWYWDFGSVYVSCFDVYVDVDGAVETAPPSETATGSDDQSDDGDTEWHLLSPICYKGAEYDENIIVDTLEDLFSAVGAEFEVTEVDEHDTEQLSEICTCTRAVARKNVFTCKKVECFFCLW